MAEWINIKDIADGAKFYAGAAIRIMPHAVRACRGKFYPRKRACLPCFGQRFGQELF